MIRISEIINELEKILKEHGDLRATHWGYTGGVIDYYLPVVKEIGELRGREKNYNYTHDWQSDKRKAIEKVVGF